MFTQTQWNIFKIAVNRCAHFSRSWKQLKLKHQQVLLCRTLSPLWAVSHSSDLQLTQAWWLQPTKSRSMTTHTLSLSTASPQRMTLIQRSKWSHTHLDSTRTSMATSVLNLFITWMNAVSSFKWALTKPCNAPHYFKWIFPFMAVLNLWWCILSVVWCGVSAWYFPHGICICSYFYNIQLMFIKKNLLGHSVRYAPVAWGSQENLMGRETPAPARQIPPFPTAAMTDSEVSCPLPVRTFEFQLKLNNIKSMDVGDD